MDKDGKIGIGLLGLGVVGAEVARMLIQKSERLSQKAGRPLFLCSVLVKDMAKPRDSVVPPRLLTTNPADILNNPQVDVVVELLGGVKPATDYLRTAIAQGKHAVTANKEVMANHGPELIRLAEEHGVNLLYEASVGGGIPIIGPLQKDLLANEITSVHAIINGTTNYILTKMSQEGMDFQVALRRAQELGYAEADPAKDIEGVDAAFKLAIVAALAFHTKVAVSDVYTEGISKLTARDFLYAQELGYTIKLLAIARRIGDGLSLRVHPAMVPNEHLLSKVDGVLNAVEIEGDLVGRVVFHGQGAGPRPTASAVIGDILEVARSIASRRGPARSGTVDGGLRILPMEEMITQYYARLTVSDRAGVLAQIAKVLGDLDISIASVIQKNADAARQTAEIVVMTHPAKEAHIRQAVHQMETFGVVRDVSNVIRVEQWT
ncbi:MAG: homoserine dehydrogenase [Dehalococcoidia bacterium]|nr:homoserine dehydrogenase [Dehalococcoidia bacterium]